MNVLVNERSIEKMIQVPAISMELDLNSIEKMNQHYVIWSVIEDEDSIEIELILMKKDERPLIYLMMESDHQSFLHEYLLENEIDRYFYDKKR